MSSFSDDLMRRALSGEIGREMAAVVAANYKKHNHTYKPCQAEIDEKNRRNRIQIEAIKQRDIVLAELVKSTDRKIASDASLERQAAVLQRMDIDEEYRKELLNRQLAANEDFQRGVGHPLLKGRKPRTLVDFDVEP